MSFPVLDSVVMKTVAIRFFLPLVASLGLVTTFGVAQDVPDEVQEAREADAAPVEEAAPDRQSELVNVYQVIVDRNPFNLQPPAPPAPPKKEEEPAKESVSLKELNITLAGVSTRNGDKRVWLSMTLPPSQPEQDPVERFFGFRENDQQHGITVKSIQPNGNIDIEYDGNPVLLSFETHGNKKKPKPKAKAKTTPKTNVRTARTTSAGNRGVTARTGNTTRNSAQPASRTNTGARNIPVGRSVSAGGVRTIPARPVRTQQQPPLSRAEQVTLIEAQKTMAEKEGRPFPPIPPLRR